MLQLTKQVSNKGEELMPRIAIFAGCIIMLAVTPAFAQTKAMIQGLDDKWAEAFNKGDAAGVAAMYTADAYVLPPGAEMVNGRNAIEALWRANMQQIGDIKCTALNVKRLGRNAAREIGTCSFKTKVQPPQDGSLKYAVVWQKEGGQWKLLQDIWNTSKLLARKVPGGHRAPRALCSWLGSGEGRAWQKVIGSQLSPATASGAK
jgi:uncharacterized protein (TIGR02246 family)